MAKKVTVRAYLGEHVDQGVPQLGAVLDMLRYCELLHSNVRGFPHVIEYTANDRRVALDQIARWRSYGLVAEVVS